MPVGLLMIGGEFDLSTGVMTGVTAIVMALLVGNSTGTRGSRSSAPSSSPPSSACSTAYVVVKTKLPSFIVTLATFFILRGVERRRRAAAQPVGARRSRSQAEPGGAELSAKSIFGSSFGSSGALPSGYRQSILWFIGGDHRRHVGAQPHDVRQLDLRLRAGSRTRPATSAFPSNRTKILLFMGTALAAALVG